MSRTALSFLPCKPYRHKTASGSQQTLALNNHVPLTTDAGSTLPIPPHLLLHHRQSGATARQRAMHDSATIEDTKRDAPHTANRSWSPKSDVDVNSGQDVGRQIDGAGGAVNETVPVPALAGRDSGGYRDGFEVVGDESTTTTTNRGSLGDAVTASVVTSGSTVDRVLCVVQSSLVVVGPAAESGNSNNAIGLARPSAGLEKNPAAVQAEAVDEAVCPNEGSMENDDNDGVDSNGSGEKLKISQVAVVDLSRTQLEQALRLVLDEVSVAISAARLRWCDVSNLRVYYQQPHQASSSEIPHVRPTAAAAAHDGKAAEVAGGERDCQATTADLGGLLLERAFFLALAGMTPARPAVTLVPVLGAAGGAHVCVHATAWSLDRLKTELWVRGTA